MKAKYFAILIFTSLVIGEVYGIDNREVEFEGMIKNTYDFYPRNLDKKGRNSKAQAMDKVWELVKSDQEFYLPLLRKELQKPNSNTFFLFDGANLLTSITALKNETDNNIILDAISKSSLKDVDHYSYFFLVWQLGIHGLNTYKAVEKMINTPEFSIYVPAHVLKLGQDYSLYYCLLVIDEKYYIDPLADRLLSETNEEISKTIIMNLAYTVTAKGQLAINNFIKVTKNRELKKYAEKYSKLEEKNKLPKQKITVKRKYLFKFLKDLLNREYESKEYNIKEYYSQAFYIVKKEDYSKLKQLRRNQAKRLSDEALEEMDYLTMLLQYSFTSKD